jgi:hypothetical protein
MPPLHLKLSILLTVYSYVAYDFRNKRRSISCEVQKAGLKKSHLLTIKKREEAIYVDASCLLY